MNTTPWSLQRAYAALILPAKGAPIVEPPTTYVLRLEQQFRRGLTSAIDKAKGRHFSAVVLRMDDQREHPVRELLLKLAFGQTRTPLTAMTDLAARLSTCTDKRTGPSLMVSTLEERGETRRVSMYVFPQEETYTLKRAEDASEAFLELLHTFVLQSRLQKVARFEGKNIKSHFISGEVADLQIGTGPRTAADYWVDSFLDAEFSLNEYKGTTLVAAGLKAAFDKGDPAEKQQVMEAAIALMADNRRAWSLHKIAASLIPEASRGIFCSVANNEETLTNSFMLSKDLLKARINYRVFQLENGIWVSAPFAEIGHGVKIEARGKKRTLIASGVVESEGVQSNAKKRRRH